MEARREILLPVSWGQRISGVLGSLGWPRTGGSKQGKGAQYCFDVFSADGGFGRHHRFTGWAVCYVFIVLLYYGEGKRKFDLECFRYKNR